MLTFVSSILTQEYVTFDICFPNLVSAEKRYDFFRNQFKMLFTLYSEISVPCSVSPFDLHVTLTDRPCFCVCIKR